MKTDEAPLLKRIFQLVAEFPRYGYRRITRLLRNEGWRVNAKRIYRLWRQEGLKVPQKKRKRRRLGSAKGGVTRLQASGRNHVWSVDFIFDRTSNGRPLKILVVIDEYTRECLAVEVGRRFTGNELTELLGNLLKSHGVPDFIRSDNGPEFVSQRVREFLDRIDVQPSYIEPGSPWQNGCIESFNSRFRDGCLSCEEFSTVQEARQIIEQWRQTCNCRRPHSSLNGLTPNDYARSCAASAPAGDGPALQQHNTDLSQPLLS